MSEGAGGRPYWGVIAAGAGSDVHTLTRSADAGVPWRIDLDSWLAGTAPHRTQIASHERSPYFSKTNGNASDDYGGLAVAGDGTVYAAFADPRGVDAARIAIVRAEPRSS